MNHKRNDPVEVKVKRCLNSVGNLHTNLYNKLYEDLQTHPLSSSVSKLRNFVVSLLELPTSGKNTKIYWIKRGWSEAESYVKSKENNKKHKFVSPYSREFWVNKINPITEKYYTIEEADFERNSRRPIKKEYWILKGFPIEQAKILAENTKKENTKKATENSKNISKEVRKACTKFCLEYWTLRGYSEEEAKKLIEKNYKVFSLEFCIEKYGKQKGEKIWKNRQVNWQKTLKSKSDEEIQRINKEKNIYRLEKFNSVDELIKFYEKTNKLTLCRTEDELIEKILKDLDDNTIKKYWDSEKYLNTIPKTQFKVIQTSKKDILDKIKHLFKSEAILLENNGAYKNYIMYVEGGVLRSSYEIHFYEEIKKIDETLIVSIDKNYPNSKMRYDFYMKNGDYIEICPILNDMSTHIKKEKYKKNFDKKVNLFHPIVLKTFEDINNYIKNYKNESISNS